MEASLANGVEDVLADHCLAPNPHVPVHAWMRPELTTVSVFQLAKQPQLPLELPVGPRPAAQDWSKQIEVVKAALTAHELQPDDPNIQHLVDVPPNDLIFLRDGRYQLEPFYLSFDSRTDLTLKACFIHAILDRLNVRLVTVFLTQHLPDRLQLLTQVELALALVNFNFRLLSGLLADHRPRDTSFGELYGQPQPVHMVQGVHGNFAFVV